YTTVARARPRSLGEPPNTVDGVLAANPPNGHPLSWRWQFGEIPPKELLSQMESQLLTEHHEQFVLIKRTCRLSRNPRASNVDYERSVFFEASMKGFAKWFEPLNVFVSVSVPVIFFPHEPKGWAGH